jgi:acyl-CoA reductase-like NAD-dependent aldehyde dehydrogenase
MQSTQLDAKEYGYFAGNQWRKAADNQVFEVHEPYGGKLFARVAAGSRADGPTAVDAAAKAFTGWAETTPAEKARLFLKASEIVKRRRSEIAEVLARETGSTISFATFQQDLVAATLQQVAGWVYLPKGEVLETNAPGSHSIGVRRPLGVVASFTPWNGANVLSWRAVISPVAAGNTVVVKPSEFAPVSAGIMLAEVAEEELGGFNPMIILDDVNMDYAVRTATFGSFFHQGQICLNTRRIIIQRKIYEEFLGKFVARTKSLPAGDPLDPKTIIGPIITRDAVKLIDDRVKDAIARGARAHTGAKHDGQIYYPTILTDVPLDAAIANEETFGPVVVVEVVDTPEEAIAAANRTLYGLTSSILAGNTYKAFEMAPKVLAGIVNVNSPTVNDEIHAPMGGVRDSGWGRTGPRSLDDFSDVIWINSHSGQRQYPF